MSPVRPRHPISAILLGLTLCLAAGPQASTETRSSGSIAGQLLVASPSIGDPRFDRTVILMVHHDKNGAFGIVINRPIGQRPLARLLEMLGEKETAVVG
jgi:putative AlgH/UPF0301 family transcriptional regulator